ncbi:MAG: hypothetical protein JO314_09940 [Acidobacteria bacterium]|nr:hypothetical protein [Acidobacteriota bacterium]
MKSSCLLIFAAAVIAVAMPVCTSAQARPIDPQEVDRIIAAARTLSQSGPVRAKMSWGYTEPGKDLTLMSSQTVEMTGKDRRHGISQKFFGSQQQKVETITIDSTTYRREGDGPWTSEPTNAAVSNNGGSFLVSDSNAAGTRSTAGYVASGGRASAPFDMKSIAEDLGSETAVGVTLHHYRVTDKINMHDSESTSTHDYWLEASGRLTKEMISHSTGISTRVTVTTLEYEYPSSITIEAPIK